MNVAPELGTPEALLNRSSKGMLATCRLKNTTNSWPSATMVPELAVIYCKAGTGVEFSKKRFRVKTYTLNPGTSEEAGELGTSIPSKP